MRRASFVLAVIIVFCFGMCETLSARGPSPSLRRRQKLSGPAIKEYDPLKEHPSTGLGLKDTDAERRTYRQKYSSSGQYFYKTFHGCGCPGLGIDLGTNNMILHIVPGSPAQLGGLEPGDRIVSINGQILETRKQFQVGILGTKQGDRLRIEYMRQDKTRMAEMVFGKDYFPYIRKILEVLHTGDPVSVIVITGSFNNILIDFDESLADKITAKKTWQEMSTNEMVSNQEVLLLEEFSGYENFKIIERSLIAHILEELQFSASGYISSESQQEIGSLTGADYILYISGSRTYQNPKSKTILDTDTYKLISIKTGEVHASSNVKMLFDGKNMKILKNYYDMN